MIHDLFFVVEILTFFIKILNVSDFYSTHGLFQGNQTLYYILGEYVSSDYPSCL